MLKAYIEGMEWPCFVNINERTEFIVKTEIPSYPYGIEFSTTYDKYYVDPDKAVPVMLRFADINGNKGPGELFIDKE